MFVGITGSNPGWCRFFLRVCKNNTPVFSRKKFIISDFQLETKKKIRTEAQSYLKSKPFVHNLFLFTYKLLKKVLATKVNIIARR